MNPMLLAALAALAAAIPTIIFALGVLLPILRPWVKEHVSAMNRERLFRATKGAYVIVAEIARQTAGTTLDDGLAEVLRLVSNELGATLTDDQKRLVTHFALSMHADPTVAGNIGTGTSALILKSVAAGAVPVAVPTNA